MTLAVVQRGGQSLTCAKAKVIASTRWPVKITRKYCMASLVITSKMLGILIPGTLDFIVEKMISENARKSKAYIFSTGSAIWRVELRWSRRTIEEGDNRVYEMTGPMRDKHTKVICVEGYLWEWLGCTCAVTTE